MITTQPVKKQVDHSREGIHLFLSDENFNKLESIMQPIKFKARTYLFLEGDKADKLYYLRSGKVKIMQTTEDGKEMILSIMNRGELVGEYGGSVDTFHNYSAHLHEKGELGVIHIKELKKLMCEFGSFSMEFMDWLGVINQRNQSKFRDLLLFGKKGALASVLIRMSNSYGIVRPDGIELDVKLTNKEIGEFIGMMRETVNRFLSQWKEDGTISISNGHIVIRKLSVLRSLCNCPTNVPCSKDICRI